MMSIIRFYTFENKVSESYLEIQLAQQPIELCKLLKIADLVTGGGEAKVVISEGYVLLNGEVEFQKRKKVYHHDIVEFNGEVIQVVINASLSENLSDKPIENKDSQSNNIDEASDHSTSKQMKNKNIKKAVPTNEGTAKNNKRKPISF